MSLRPLNDWFRSAAWLPDRMHEALARLILFDWTETQLQRAHFETMMRIEGKLDMVMEALDLDPKKGPFWQDVENEAFQQEIRERGEALAKKRNKEQTEKGEKDGG